MTVSELDHYIAALKDRADRQRIPMPYEEAKAIVEATWIHPWAEKSVMAPVIQCRVALRRTLEMGHHHPQQLRDVFLTIARERTDCDSIAVASVDCAIRDAAANRSRGPVSDDN
jgi:hypothetical protein